MLKLIVGPSEGPCEISWRSDEYWASTHTDTAHLVLLHCINWLRVQTLWHVCIEQSKIIIKHLLTSGYLLRTHYNRDINFLQYRFPYRGGVRRIVRRHSRISTIETCTLWNIHYDILYALELHVRVNVPVHGWLCRRNVSLYYHNILCINIYV
jgi:hypothetical protein